jgi:hypothetical protein
VHQLQSRHYAPEVAHRGRGIGAVVLPFPAQVEEQSEQVEPNNRLPAICLSGYLRGHLSADLQQLGPHLRRGTGSVRWWGRHQSRPGETPQHLLAQERGKEDEHEIPRVGRHNPVAVKLRHRAQPHIPGSPVDQRVPDLHFLTPRQDEADLDAGMHAHRPGPSDRVQMGGSPHGGIVCQMVVGGIEFDGTVWPGIDARPW